MVQEGTLQDLLGVLWERKSLEQLKGTPNVLYVSAVDNPTVSLSEDERDTLLRSIEQRLILTQDALEMKLLKEIAES